MTKYTLYYFNAQGKAEPIRQMFAYGGINYEDIRFEMEDWPNQKSKMPLGKVPVLEVDGKAISQAGSILRLIAKRTGLYSTDDLECAMIDMAIDTCDELFQFIGPNFLLEPDPVKKAAALKKIDEEIVPKFLDNLEKNFGEGDYLVGGRMTVADIRFVNEMAVLKIIGADYTLDKHSKLKSLQDKVNSHPKIADWNAKRPVSKSF